MGKKYRADMAGDIAVREAPISCHFLIWRSERTIGCGVENVVISDWDLQHQGR